MCRFVGAVLGSKLSRAAPPTARIADRIAAFAPRRVPGRVAVLAVLSVLALGLAFAVMGFIPAFAADPFDAKFFRNEYAAPYAAVAPIYRATTTALMLLLPLLAMYAWWRRRFGWVLLFGVSLAALLVTLQREPALIGILLFVGVMIAMRGKSNALRRRSRRDLLRWERFVLRASCVGHRQLRLEHRAKSR